MPDDEQMEAYLSDLDDFLDTELETWSEDVEARKAVLIAMRDRLNERISELEDFDVQGGLPDSVLRRSFDHTVQGVACAATHAATARLSVPDWRAAPIRPNSETASLDTVQGADEVLGSSVIHDSIPVDVRVGAPKIFQTVGTITGRVTNKVPNNEEK